MSPLNVDRLVILIIPPLFFFVFRVWREFHVESHDHQQPKTGASAEVLSDSQSPALISDHHVCDESCSLCGNVALILVQNSPERDKSGKIRQIVKIRAAQTLRVGIII